MSEETTNERDNLLKELLNNENKRFQKAPKNRRAELSDQERKVTSERMKKYWSHIKARNLHQ